MKKKISLIAALMALVFIFGCAELVFVKDAKLYRVKDNGDELQQIIPLPPPASGNKFHRPDVNHNGDKVAFIAGTSDDPFGTLWTMELDGSPTRQINLDGSVTIVVRWYPDNEQYIAYFGKDINGQHAICRARTDRPPANYQRICDTGGRDDLGFDINKPQSGPHQVIFARREPAPNNKPRLWRRQVEFDPAACVARNPEPIIPFPPSGVPIDVIEETFPVISFSQEMLASAVKWPGVMGIRVRGIGQDGTIGLPLTYKLLGFQEITGVSFADEDQKIYLSAKKTGEEYNLYYIGVKEILRGFADLVNLPPSDIPPAAIEINPVKIDVGSGKNIWPSGINAP